MLFQEMVALPVPVKPTVVVPPSEDYDLVYDLPLLALADATDQLGEEEPRLPLLRRIVAHGLLSRTTEPRSRAAPSRGWRLKIRKDQKEAVTRKSLHLKKEDKSEARRQLFRQPRKRK